MDRRASGGPPLYPPDQGWCKHIGGPLHDFAPSVGSPIPASKDGSPGQGQAIRAAGRRFPSFFFNGSFSDIGGARGLGSRGKPGKAARFGPWRTDSSRRNPQGAGSGRHARHGPQFRGKRRSRARYGNSHRRKYFAPLPRHDARRFAVGRSRPIAAGGIDLATGRWRSARTATRRSARDTLCKMTVLGGNSSSRDRFDERQRGASRSSRSGARDEAARARRGSPCILARSGTWRRKRCPRLRPLCAVRPSRRRARRRASISEAIAFRSRMRSSCGHSNP